MKKHSRHFHNIRKISLCSYCLYRAGFVFYLPYNLVASQSPTLYPAPRYWCYFLASKFLLAHRHMHTVIFIPGLFKINVSILISDVVINNFIKMSQGRPKYSIQLHNSGIDCNFMIDNQLQPTDRSVLPTFSVIWQ